MEVGRNLNAIEFYELSKNSMAFPLTAVDIASNTYIRLTYQKPNGKSGTLGTSVVGTISFRTSDNVLHFVPTISEAALSISQEGQPEVTLKGKFGDIAEITSTRRYRFKSSLETSCELNLTLEALSDIELATHSLGHDAFRFGTISSMYTPQCYDANLIQYSNALSESKELKLDQITKRATYIFNRSAEISSTLALKKDKLSRGPIGTPGSKDSPSICLSISENKYRLGAQAYLSESLDINADSLSLWLEWCDAPQVIKRGTILSIAYTISATAPE
jgi:hypothetical protein